MLRSVVIAAVMTLAPMVALAGGCGADHAVQEAMTCIEGTVWDETSARCVKVTG